MGREITPEESARRVRAAMGYAGVEFADLAAETSIPAGTLRGYSSRTRPTKASLEKRLVIGDACGVPRWFMESGFERQAALKVPHHGSPADDAADLVTTTQDGLSVIVQTKVQEALAPLVEQLATYADVIIELEQRTGVGSLTEELVQFSRRSKQAHTGPPAGGASTTGAGTGTRDEADATAEVAPVRAAGKRRSAGRPGR